MVARKRKLPCINVTRLFIHAIQKSSFNAAFLFSLIVKLTTYHFDALQAAWLDINKRWLTGHDFLLEEFWVLLFLLLFVSSVRDWSAFLN